MATTAVEPFDLMDTDTVEEVRLKLEQYCVAALVDDDWKDPQVSSSAEYRLEYLAHSLAASFTAPARILQQDRVIAEYPKGLWDYIKRRLGFKYRTVQVRLTEHLLYQNVPVIPNHSEVRLYVRSRVE